MSKATVQQQNDLFQWIFDFMISILLDKLFASVCPSPKILDPKSQM